MITCRRRKLGVHLRQVHAGIIHRYETMGMDDQLVILGQALSCASRVHILQLVGEMGLSVGAAVAQTGLAQATVSRHLAVLVQAGLVEKCRQGSRHVYRWPARRLFIGFR